MKSKIVVAFTLLALITVICVNTAVAQGQTPTDAAPIGLYIESQVKCGDAAGSLEPYDMKIALLEAVRGKEAWDKIQAASASNQPPKAGFEYIAARVAFEMTATGAPGNKTFDLARPMQFTALASDGSEYETPSVVPPKPELKRAVPASDPAEGWIVFLVKQADSKPLMMFDPASGGAMGRGKLLFFQLY